MSTGVDSVSVQIRLPHETRWVGTDVAWVTCDAPGCRAVERVFDVIDTEPAIREADREGWDCTDDSDLCPEHKGLVLAASEDSDGAP